MSQQKQSPFAKSLFPWTCPSLSRVKTHKKQSPERERLCGGERKGRGRGSFGTRKRLGQVNCSLKIKTMMMRNISFNYSPTHVSSNVFLYYFRSSMVRGSVKKPRGGEYHLISDAVKQTSKFK